ncbi:hypothetical protein Bbelb_236280 [Branchiostoma belcheri]|nr:hypothetical protein Bbelb_236280 [Branchiostoma belcheri]
MVSGVVHGEVIAPLNLKTVSHIAHISAMNVEYGNSCRLMGKVTDIRVKCHQFRAVAWLILLPNGSLEPLQTDYIIVDGDSTWSLVSMLKPLPNLADQCQPPTDNG